MTFRELAVLALDDYRDCERCTPGVQASVLQLAVPEADWPYLKKIVAGIVESYSVDWAAFAQERQQRRGELKKAGIVAQ